MALFGPSIVDEDKREQVTDYNWELISDTGEPYNFNEVKRKVVVINFWATWCPPCIAEMPSLDALYKSYKEDVVFLFVSNENLETISNFISKNSYSFHVYRPKTAYPEPFDASAIPRTYILDKKGNIVIDKTGAANWNSEKVREQLDWLLKE
ncbi:TlpA family protein disulfide reductase [Formosa maritima]|uniref:TlpA family protein disulfide reductase n=1 Tax=Formosa maritima TaxID=2592046 RepID=A0A5D0G1L6_9FLAO|nr:TlpA family protein disulfide reductase [Formosa maritima]